jgi:hypothetical protein
LEKNTEFLERAIWMSYPTLVRILCNITNQVISFVNKKSEKNKRRVQKE